MPRTFIILSLPIVAIAAYLAAVLTLGYDDLAKEAIGVTLVVFGAYLALAIREFAVSQKSD